MKSNYYIIFTFILHLEIQFSSRVRVVSAMETRILHDTQAFLRFPVREITLVYLIRLYHHLVYMKRTIGTHSGIPCGPLVRILRIIYPR